MSNLALWEAVEKTDTTQTKPITGKAYSGTSPKPYYLVKKATETFGPCGQGWGFEIVDEKLLDGALLEPGFYERIHMARVRVWYEWDGKRGTVEHVGQTLFSGKRNNGKVFTDEDAPKKSVTDALVKALSMIGFAGDIFMGRFDDSKYVADLKREEASGGFAPNARTRAEISAHKQFKEKNHDEIINDLSQIESTVALDRYQREVLTPDLMAKMGTVAFHIEERVERRRAELDGPAPTKAQSETAKELVTYLRAARTPDDLKKRAQAKDYKDGVATLTEAQTNDLRGVYHDALVKLQSELVAAG